MDDLVTADELARILSAYRRGLTADMIQMRIGGEWGVIWTIPPCSPEALERVAHQVRRCRADRVRHIRRARLMVRGADPIEAVILTEISPVIQEVRCLRTACLVLVGEVLTDHGLQRFLVAP